MLSIKNRLCRFGIAKVIKPPETANDFTGIFKIIFVLGNFLGNGEIYFADYLIFMIFYGKLFLIHTWKNGLIRLTIN